MRLSPPTRSLQAWRLVLLLVAAAGSFPLAQQPAKRAITETDIFRFIWVADPQVSPDGKRVAFTRVNVNEKGDGYETSIWSVAADGGAAPARMTGETHDSQPRWSPDGKRLAFLRAAMKDGKPQPPQLYVMALSGGEAWKQTDLPQGVSAARWSPDGKRVAFTSVANDNDLEKQNKERSAKKSVQQETKDQAPAKASEDRKELDHESDMRIITRAVYRSNDAGYLDPKHIAHIWVADVPDFAEEVPAAKQLTTGKYEESDPFWSRDGAIIYFSTTRIDEPYYELPHRDVYGVPSTGGETQQIAALDMDISSMSLSPDGKRIAFEASVTTPVRSYSEPNLWTLELTPGAKPVNITEKLDLEIGGGVGGDNRAPRGDSPSLAIWTMDGKAVIEVVAKEGRANLMRFPLDGGQPSEITSGRQAVLSFSSNSGSPGVNGPIALIISTPTAIGDLWMLDPGGKPRQLTHFNQALFSQLNIAEPDEIWYTSFDAKKIQAWVQKPPDFDSRDANKKYPLILNIHGGPHSAYGWIFDHEFQWMAAKGYVVIYPNPRGSTSYGQDFANIIQYHYPGDDFRDLMVGVDEVIKKGYIDTNRLGVTGGSGGGVLTNWTVAHTNRFRAAVSQRDIADWAAWWYTADFTLFQPEWFRQPPFLDPEDYKARSSLTYVQNINTPMLFVLGEADFRTPTQAGGEMLFRALKYLKRPTAMVRFPGETHELSRSGQPWHRVERLQSIVGWMDKYLLGTEVAQFKDVTGQTSASTPEAAERPK